MGKRRRFELNMHHRSPIEISVHSLLLNWEETAVQNRQRAFSRWRLVNC